MTRFRYVATTEDGRTVERTADARSEAALRAELLRANLAVQTVGDPAPRPDARCPSASPGSTSCT
ncbi:MAG: hypothetical protein KatS3mg010_0900 [Acidimicrobiia bacterium]|nr:MAG: hypothetical protein KatS3mg010_0900 [Acidimicrobiia bacterium]